LRASFTGGALSPPGVDPELAARPPTQLADRRRVGRQANISGMSLSKGCRGVAPHCDPDHRTDFATTPCCDSSQLNECAESRRHTQSQPAEIHQKPGAIMYSIIVLICSTALSHADCQAKTAVDVVRGPTVDNPMMCAFNAQTIIARTVLVQTCRLPTSAACAQRTARYHVS
jgi:hypothetical protein